MPANEPYDQAKVVLDAADEDLIRMIAGSGPGSRLEAINAEITLRNMRWQKESALAQRDAALYTRANARWTFGAALAAAISALLSFATLIWQIWGPHS